MMKVVRLPVVRFVVIIVCAFVSFGLIRSLLDNWRKGDQVSVRRAVLSQEQDKNRRLQNKLKEATSASFIEQEARDKLGLAKPGETIILMGTPAPGGDLPQNPGEAPLSRWQRWWKLFF